MSFQSLTPEVLAQLTAALPESVLTGDQISEDYAHDEMVSAGFRMPEAVVMARSTEEVSTPRSRNRAQRRMCAHLRRCGH